MANKRLPRATGLIKGKAPMTRSATGVTAVKPRAKIDAMKKSADIRRAEKTKPYTAKFEDGSTKQYKNKAEYLRKWKPLKGK